ncbi:hypothetical protein ACDF64_01750 [Agromyces sp. MMS24-JH15]|uniref:hypothetical protein n=1 Tax=Agromyces sp. MMS24-JH15 TaxID=3243765 RepID=UPI00374A6AA7
MHIVGVLPEDAPDPRLEAARRLTGLSFPVMGFAPQPAVEDDDLVSFLEIGGMDGLSQQSASITSLLWRNPADRSDPANLADLDDRTRAALDDEPPWPRPAWLLEYVARLRYPQLWEAVRTTWTREPSEFSTPSRQLADHANHILMNTFRTELGLGDGPVATDGAWRVTESAANPSARLEIDGDLVPALEIDTDPFVYAIGAQLSAQVVTTVVVAREHLPHLRMALATRHATDR